MSNGSTEIGGGDDGGGDDGGGVGWQMAGGEDRGV